jgi:hypothetical protein
MRIRALLLVAVLAPSAASAQVLRLPRRGQTATEPTPLPKEAPDVARALALTRSRWSADGYSLISTISAPSPTGGGLVTSTAFGAGTHLSYRYTDAWSATGDVTVSPLGGALYQTAEVGTRFASTPWSPDFRSIRPFADLRAAYMHMSDTYATSAQLSGGIPGTNAQLTDGVRYSRGFGAVGGAGLELPLTGTLALTTEVSAMRNRMTVYRLTGPAGIPGGSSYWMTSMRFAFGLTYSRLNSLSQTPR